MGVKTVRVRCRAIELVLTNAGSIPATSTMSKQQQQITKQLQNLYSWTQFYQEVGNKEQIRKCQTQIAALKKAYNETKTKK